MIKRSGKSHQNCPISWIPECGSLMTAFRKPRLGGWWGPHLSKLKSPGMYTSPKFKGHLEGTHHNPILRGLGFTSPWKHAYENHLQVRPSWDNPSSELAPFPNLGFPVATSLLAPPAMLALILEFRQLFLGGLGWSHLLGCPVGR